jgi:hypothetical protein
VDPECQPDVVVAGVHMFCPLLAARPLGVVRRQRKNERGREVYLHLVGIWLPAGNERGGGTGTRVQRGGGDTARHPKRAIGGH